MEQYKNRYRHDDIKAQILVETSEKCAYCESKVRHTYPGEIEHIKPQANFEDDIFEWENLTFACTECNRRKLNNYDDDIGIINPYIVDPEEHLTAYGPMILPNAGDPVGKLAYELFELNRMPLLERRKDRLEKLSLIFDDYVSEKNALLKKLYKRKVDSQAEKSKEYAMVAQAYIKAAMKAERAKTRSIK